MDSARPEAKCYGACEGYSWVLSLQGIERLKAETPAWERVPCWQSVKAAFGGPPSLAWLSPFSELSCARRPSPRVHAEPQGGATELDIIEIPVEC